MLELILEHLSLWGSFVSSLLSECITSLQSPTCLGLWPSLFLSNSRQPKHTTYLNQFKYTHTHTHTHIHILHTNQVQIYKKITLKSLLLLLFFCCFIFISSVFNMQNSMFCSGKDMVSKFSDDEHFDKSLQELRDLRSQLHNAAEFCESAFLHAKEKKDVVENTKEYVCRAMVTLVDHFGCVSDNLNALISHTNSFSDAELRINSLKQRFLLSEQYAHKLALNRLQLREVFPRHHPRYLSTPIRNSEKLDEDSRNEVISTKAIDKDAFKREDDMPLFVYTFSHKATISKGETNSALLWPVQDGLSILSKAPNPSFHFQEKRKIVRTRRSLHGSDILSLIRRTRRTT